jgi:hypothetical protein
MRTLKEISIVIAIIFTTMGVAFVNYQFWTPKFQNVERDVFENTKSYNKGKVAELVKYYDEYRNSENEEDKIAIKNLVKISFIDFDASKIQEYKLQSFLRECRGY